MLRLAESPLVAGSINQRSRRYNRNPDPLFSLLSLLVSPEWLWLNRPCVGGQIVRVCLLSFVQVWWQLLIFGIAHKRRVALKKLVYYVM